MTAASLINSGQTHILGEPVFKYVQSKVSIKREKRDCKWNDDILVATRKLWKDVDSVIVHNKGKALDKWTMQDLKFIIKPEKTKYDGVMPTKKKQT
jgi:predicted ThiF/HesA family dinucleotide-utilizing enzyme